MRFYVIQNNFFYYDEVAVKATDSTSFFSISLKRSIYALKLSFLIR